MKNTEFIKMHGLGNDFVILDGRKQVFENKEDLARKIADRHFGVGCDQLIIMESSKTADAFMRISNPDGSESGACGNATRCVADILMREKNCSSVIIETQRGQLECQRAENDWITVDMGEPRLQWDEIPLAREVDTLYLPVSPADGDFPERLPIGVNMGNPHCVFFVDDFDRARVSEVGPDIEYYDLFPERTNVEFAKVLDQGTLRMRVWERGAGITLACGSGACATAVAAIRRGYTDRTVLVKMDGGDLKLEWRESDNHVYMTGPVTYVFTGVINLL